MRKALRPLLIALAVGTVALACVKVPYTGRRQFNLVPDSIMQGLGASTYQSMLADKVVVNSGTNNAILSRVGGRISKVANKPDFAWEYSLIQEDTLNAWCLPGGKIGFYTGILPVLRNESGMAFVMGHEVGHATARHGSERLSQNLAMVGGLGALELVLAGKTKLTQEQRAIVLGAIGVGAQVGVILPFSRAHESEADVIGLMYMANAGYPPQESIVVWDRMAAAAGGGGAPAFLSTHPPHEKRQAVLRDWMDNAEKRFARNKLSGDMLAPLWTGPVPTSGASKGGGTTTSGTKGGGTTTPTGGGTTSDEPRTSGGNR